MILIDFWGDNPFQELDLSFPPVPTPSMIEKKIKEEEKAARKKLRKLHGVKGQEAEEEQDKLQKEIEAQRAKKKEYIALAKELNEFLPFETLLSVAPIAPDLIADHTQRATVLARAWKTLWGVDDLFLSDTLRSNFRKDFTRSALLDRQS